MCDCNNCYVCLTNEDLQKIYIQTMKIPIKIRMLSCNCFMCNDKNSATCYEIEYFSNGDDFDESIIRLKKDIFKIKKSFFISYLKCMGRFLSVFKNTLHKRYQPGGNGFEEAKQNFNKRKLIF